MDYKELAPEYISLFEQAELLPRTRDKKKHPIGLDDIQDFVSDLVRGKDKYEQAESRTKVPWFFIGLIHGLECSFNFSQHLHNGDSLLHRTVNEPKGRPLGNPPFTWQESAYDALKYEREAGTWATMAQEDWEDWGVSSILYKLEAWNGWGFRMYHPNVRSPYLWSGSSLYDKGKYVSDGKFDPNLISKQVGAAAALKYMTANHIIALEAMAT